MSFWTTEREDELRSLWALGLSASQIANRMHTPSRNSIIGKVHRLGLPQRRKQPQMTAAQRLQALEVARQRKNELERQRRSGPVGLPKFPWRHKPQEASMDIPVEQRVSIMELTSQTCRWPLWGDDQREGLYCGAATVPGQPYCCGHCALSFNMTERQRQRAA